MLVIEQSLIADLQTYNVAAIKGRKDLNMSIYPDSLNYIYTFEAGFILCFYPFFKNEIFLNNYIDIAL